MNLSPCTPPTTPDDANGSPVDTGAHSKPALWDLFCRVVDNFGDVGVCWRLAADLATRGQRVRLWCDDPSALAWMAPGGSPQVQVMPWPERLSHVEPGEVVIEAFACDPPADFVRAMAAAPRPHAAAHAATATRASAFINRRLVGMAGFYPAER